jgi:hypothetical protein
MARSFGYASSPIIADPETIQNTIPKPKIIRATMYIAATINQSGTSKGEKAGAVTILSKALQNSATHHCE